MTDRQPISDPLGQARSATEPSGYLPCGMRLVREGESGARTSKIRDPAAMHRVKIDVYSDLGAAALLTSWSAHGSIRFHSTSATLKVK